MAKPRTVANPLALAVLAFLSREPMHPYELGKRLQEAEKDRSFKYNRGSLYMVVKQLAKAGFVADRETVRDAARPERTLYEITDDGRAELRDWLRELLAEPREEYPLFGAALSLIVVLPPEEATTLLEQRLAALAEARADTRTAIKRAAEAEVLWVFSIEEEYRLAVLDAEYRFVTGLITSLRRPDYVQAWQDFFGRRT
ncbi:MAG TPA: PadR family transcriptional regulator [Streptosporangiaceae bacterium]|jgi:DNA-binding PadR family transcriptional regulator